MRKPVTISKNVRLVGLILFFFTTTFSFCGMAQRNCGSTIPSPDEMRRNPAIKAFYDSLETAYRNWSANTPPRPEAVRVFPVVVHVLYNNSWFDVTNISDAQIFSQIDILNRDFQKLNSDWSNTPATWQGLVANCEIKFCLASKDPNGNYTSGIVRKYTDSTNFVVRSNPKMNATGGSDAWSTDQYINIWVVPSLFTGTTNLLGYATFPYDLAGVHDGIVIRHNAFGNTGTAAAPFNLGRTATHEMGHFFGLVHIWGDDQSNSNNCTGDDSVGDTPNQAVSSGGCPGFPFTDNCSPASPGIMFMNFMDYTDDACMYMFTNGQLSRMDFYIYNFANRSVLLGNVNNACGSCDVLLSLSGNSPANGFFYKAKNINSTQVVSTGGTLVYKAGTTVRLLPGFRCTTGRNLYVGNEICYPSN